MTSLLTIPLATLLQTATTPIVHLPSPWAFFSQNFAYLLAAALFIWGLKMMGHPRSARGGNFLSAVGMLIAILATLVDREIMGFNWIIAGVLVGSAIGAVLALKVQMTSMPQMVGLLNGFGGLASAVVAYAEYLVKQLPDHTPTPRIDTVIAIALSLLIGGITFTGSVTAYGKLEGWKIKGRNISNPVTFSMQHFLNLLLLLAVIGLTVILVQNTVAHWAVLLILAIALILGVLVVIPIGGADMPVVISLLNSYSGLAGMATGFALDNKCLIITGSLVGASGIILTKIMCKAMNRSLLNVVAGGFGSESEGVATAPGAGGAITVRRMDADETVMTLENAASVVIVPGYGMAVAQAQHAVAELALLLTRRGTSVKFGIHPVAGRMPGHMNVLLAEANVPYDQLSDLEINGEFQQCDVALVIGANDVVNPAARHDKSSPIYGMPILDVDKAKTVIVCKRSLNPGFAGIENELFTKDNTVMLFGDAKKTISEVVSQLKEITK